MHDSYEMALYLTQGNRAMVGLDLANATYVLSFGSGLIEGWGSVPFMYRARAAMRENGGKLSQTEPRLSKTAAKADQWVAIKPGSEGALAFGLIHVILKDGTQLRLSRTKTGKKKMSAYALERRIRLP